MYESGYTLRMYQILENDLVDFLNYIPIDYYFGDERKIIYSPWLAELLIRIGSQVDNFFKYWKIVREVYENKHPDKKFDPRNLKINHYKDIEIDGKIILSNKEINILSTDEDIKPFVNWTLDSCPQWWTAYNHVKHQGFTYKKDGNLFNVIESLSALFLLNCINEDTKFKLIEYGYGEISKSEYRTIRRGKKRYIPLDKIFRSQLFEYEMKRKINKGIRNW